MTPEIQLVVAHYTEPLNWLKNIPRAIHPVVYDKHPDYRTPGAISLLNIGREAHSYLHHICENYENLADVTVFAQGKPFDHAFDFHKTLKSLTGQENFRWLGHLIDTDTRDGARLFATWSKNTGDERLDMGGFHRALFGSEGPREYSFVLGGQFLVSREKIQSRPLEFWWRALDISTDFPDAAHCFERTWNRVFGEAWPDEAFLAGRKTVALKPIRAKGNPDSV